MSGGVDRFNNAASSTSRKTVGSLTDTGNVSVSLTNLTANSDALGKPIPRTFGHVVIGGALVWASPYYIITRGFTQETQYWTDTDYHDVEHTDSSALNGTRVTLVEKSEYGIDLCYSFGFEGQQGSRRKIVKFKINGVEVYNAVSGYVMPGIGFDIREGQDLDIPAAMAKYELTGKYFYPGQTLIVLQQFRTAMWGGALPQSVEVEFVAESALGQTGQNKIDFVFPSEFFSPDNLNSFIEPDYRRAYFYDQTVNSLYVFDMDSGVYLETLVINGPAKDDLKTSANGLNLGQTCLCGDLRALCLFISGFGAGVYIDLTNGYSNYLGVESSTDIMCLTSNATQAVVIGNTLSDPFRYNVTLARDEVGDPVSIVGRTFGPVPWVLWWQGSHGYGKGFACAYRGNTIALFAADGSYKTATIPQEHIDNGSVINSIIAYKGGAVVYVGKGSSPAFQYLIAYNADGSIRAQRNVPVFYPYMRHQFHAGGMSKPSNRYFGVNDLRKQYYVDLDDLSVTVFGSDLDYYYGYDPITNKDFGKAYSQGLYPNAFIAAGPALLDAKIKIIDLFKELYHTAGIYDRNNVIGSADLLDSISGVILVANIDVISFVDQLCQLYRIQKTERPNGVYFYKTRSVAVGVKVSAVIDVSELAIDLTENDDPTPIQSERQSEDTQPVAITLKYIDSNIGYKENTVSWRRVDTQQANGQELQLALPLVLTAEDALTLVQQAVVDSTASVFTHRFRLPPRLASILTAGDIITIVDGPYRTTVDIELLDYNGDLSGSVEATSIGQVNVVNVPIPALNSPINNPTQGIPPQSVGYVIDSPTLTNTDKPEAGKIVVYESITSDTLSENYTGGYFGRRLENGAWGSLPTFVNQQQTIVFRAKTVLTDKRWTVDTDELTINRISGKLPPNKTLTELQTDPLANLAWYGRPGRWELIKFCSAEGGKLSGGIMRGLRGTEVNCGKHQVDDLVICASVNVVNETRLTDTIGKPEEWKPVSVGRAFNSAASLPLITLEGNSVRPFAVAAILGQRGEDGSLSLTWGRRDRAGSAWGQDALPLSDPLSFRVRIMSADGLTVIREWMVEAEAATYSAADRTTDGTAAEGPIKVQVAQMSADNNVGAGFSETVTVNG